MIALLLAWCLAASAAEVVDVTEGRLARVGEVLGDATVSRIEQHPQFERITVTLPDSGIALPLEVTFAHPDTSPACVFEGRAVYPRFELTGGQVLPEASPATDALCARLEERGGGLTLLERVQSEGPGGGARSQPTAAAGGGKDVELRIPGADLRPWRPLQALYGALALMVLLALPAMRRSLADAPWRDGLVVAALGAVLRLSLSPRGLQIAPDAGYERLVEAWGINEPHPLYGDGYAALHAPLQWLTGWDPAALFDLHLALSALAPPLLWALAWLLLRERWGALLAGVGLATLPVALRLAGSEVAHVPLATLETLAVTAGVAFALRPAAALAAVSALAMGAAVHLRPEALPAALLPAGLLLGGAWRHREARSTMVAGVVAASVLVVLVALRVASVPALAGDGPVRPAAFLSRSLWAAVVVPPLSPLDHRESTFQVFLDPRTTSPLLPLLALAGLVLARGRQRWVAALAVSWWGLALLPILPKAWPVLDAWRLQLAGQVPLLLLAGLGCSQLPRLRPVAVGLVAASLVFHVGMVRERWAGMDEWAWLGEALGRLPESATVLYADHEVHGAKTAQVGALLNRRAGDAEPWWTPMGEFVADPQPGSDLYAWFGLTCRIRTLPGRRVENDASVNPCLQLAQACRLTPFAVTEVGLRTDVDLAFLQTPVEVGLYRVDGCGEGHQGP